MSTTIAATPSQALKAQAAPVAASKPKAAPGPAAAGSAKSAAPPAAVGSRVTLAQGGKAGPTLYPAASANRPAATPSARPANAAPATAAPATASDGKSVAKNNGKDLVATGGDVVVDINASDSGYNNRIFYSTDNFKTKHYIGVDNHQASVNLGPLAAGTKIQFGIDNGAGQFFQAGNAAANVDKLDHAQVSKTANGVKIGFEDLLGGGDNDFNDAIITVRNVGVAGPAVPEAGGKGKADATNRSGLGDGTNPGQGAGRSNAGNEGSNNPGATTASAAGRSPLPAPAAKPVVPPAAVARPGATAVSNIKGGTVNRSGLGDGSNPGQGAGTVNSPNQGINNPGAVKLSTTLVNAAVMNAAKVNASYGQIQRM